MIQVPDFVDGSFPFAYTTMDWWRGNLLEEKTYKKSGNDYIQVKKVTDSNRNYLDMVFIQL